MPEQPVRIEHQRFHNMGIGRKFVSLLILTIFAIVVIIPFVYMVTVSMKSQSELGDGKLLPEEVWRLSRLQRREFAWVRVLFTQQQTALVNDITTVPIVITPLFSAAGKAVEEVPQNALPGRVVSLEKPGLDADRFIAMLEVPNRNREVENAGAVTVYVPGEIMGTWIPVPATTMPRNLSNVLSRLFANYRWLLDWEQLKAGNILHWISRGYPRWYLNSIFVAVFTVLLGLFFDSLAGFAFAKFDFPFRRFLFALLLATIMIPYPVTLVPTFFIFAKMGFYNTFAALIVPGIVSAFGIFLVKQYVQTIPDDMLDAGRVDGAGDFMVYRHIVLPIARPVLAALAVFRFIYQWNSYLYPLVLTNRDSMKTVQLGLATMEDAHGAVHYGVQMAGAALAVVPILLVYAFMQKHFISGITLGSVKD